MRDDHATLEQLSALLDSELPEIEANVVRHHLDGCPACRADVERLRETVAAVRALPTVAPPRSFRLEPVAASSPPALVRLADWLRPSPVALRAVAGVAAALMVVVFVADAFQPPAAGQGRGVAVVAPAAAPPAPGATNAGQPQLRTAPPASDTTNAGQPQLRAAPPQSASGAADNAGGVRASSPATSAPGPAFVQPQQGDTGATAGNSSSRVAPEESPALAPVEAPRPAVVGPAPAAPAPPVSRSLSPGKVGTAALALIAFVSLGVSFVVRRSG